MLKALTNLIKDFWVRHEFEDEIFAAFKAIKEQNLLQVKPYVPLMPPFQSKEIEVYRNKSKNFIFVDAFGENSCFLKHLIYSLNQTYPNHSFYIFTDNFEKVDCPSSFSIIKTERKDLYQKISELKEQIMPEPKHPWAYKRFKI